MTDDLDDLVKRLRGLAQASPPDVADNGTRLGPEDTVMWQAAAAIERLTRARALDDLAAAGQAWDADDRLRVNVKPHQIEREVWAAMGWALRHAKQMPGDLIPKYTETGNSDAEVEARRAAAAILSALAPADPAPVSVHAKALLDHPDVQPHLRNTPDARHVLIALAGEPKP